MASGKSTLGRALPAYMPGYSFIDLDEAIEEHEGCPVASIFADKGQEYFRVLESEMLRRLSCPGTIIACGGGTPCRTENMDYMLEQGLVVWLQADDYVTSRRLRLAPGQRPLVDSLLDRPEALSEYIGRLTAERMPAYSRAHLTFDSNLLEDEIQIAASCRRFVDEILLG